MQLVMTTSFASRLSQGDLLHDQHKRAKAVRLAEGPRQLRVNKVYFSWSEKCYTSYSASIVVHC